jgi:integrase
MYMRLINGRWYSQIRDPKNWKKMIQVSLDAYANETRKASINLGKVIADIENGINPTSARKNIKKIILPGTQTERVAKILSKHIYPFFGNHKPRDIDEKAIADYIESRYGRNQGGELQAFKNTVEKELGALHRLLKTVYGPTYILPKVPYKKLNREILPPLTLDQIEIAAGFVLGKYKPLFWTMAYTALDVGDALNLTPGDFKIKDGWIVTRRGKSGIEIRVPVCDPLADILKTIPWPIAQGARIFPDHTANAAAIQIRRAFDRAGLPGYGSKYLRRFIASILLDLGCSMDYIGKALAHAEGSKVTGKYTKVYSDKMEELFGQIKKKGKSNG